MDLSDSVHPGDSTGRYMSATPERKMPGSLGESVGSTASYFSDQTNATSVKKEDLLTVDRKWKVEEEIKDRETKDDKPSRLVPIFKWSATLALGAAILVLFVISKVSYIALSVALAREDPGEAPTIGNRLEWSAYTGQFLVIYLVLTVTYGLMLIRAAWMGLATRKAPWPKRSAIYCCIAMGTLEPLGLLLLSLKVLPRYTPTLGLQIMATTSMFTVFRLAYRQMNKEDDGTNRQTELWGACFCMVGGLALIVVQIIDGSDVDYELWHVVAAIVCLNVAWLPWLQRHMSESETHLRPTRETRSEFTSSMSTLGDSERPSPSSTRSTTATTTETSSEQSSVAFGSVAYSADHGNRTSTDPPPDGEYFKKATWKAAFIMYLTKVFATFLFSFLLFYVDSGHPVDESFTELMHDAFLEGWDFANSLRDANSTWTAFALNVIGSAAGYLLVFIVLHTNMQKGGLALPSLLSLPLAVLLTSVPKACEAMIGYDGMCEGGSWNDNALPEYVWPATLLLAGGQFLALGRLALRKEKFYLLKETELFWTPGYNGAVLDTWLLLSRRQAIKNVRNPRRASANAKTRVYICTTMYREDETEMQQLLESLGKVNEAQATGERFFESHIIFDGGVFRKKLSEFALLLISLLEDTLGVTPAACTKVITPYGVKLSWKLPNNGGNSMTFNIHLKDNSLVKNKKRWSQVMYMSYVLDFLSDTASPDEECYILTTDADVMFTPPSVEALLDLMSRDNTIGAVCARTHPMGTGPIVWYQKFEYAVGHWFQKAAEHVLGSVLCAPGCFSVYRCRAIRDILPKYCKKVETAFDFLTKDMGEDRWLCTLMVQSGWRIEYCAASENSTNCPAEFEEFYKQRRRWIASTLANLVLVITEWKYINLFNHRVSVVFLFYQIMLLFSTIIGPSTVILVVSGGLDYAWKFDATVSVMMQGLGCVAFVLVCVFADGKTQMLWAKILTFIYAMLMCAVAVGIAQQIVTDINPPPEVLPPGTNISIITTVRPNQHISVDIPLSVTTIYLAFLVGMFFVAGLMHPNEIFCLVHGLWYLLCLPSAYLVLIIYSVCNLTDSSWGTREAAAQNVVKLESWWSKFQTAFYEFFFCCTPPPRLQPSRDPESPPPAALYRQRSSLSFSEDGHGRHGDGRYSGGLPGIDEGEGEGRARAVSDASMNDFETSGNYTDSVTREVEDEDVPIPVEDWLPSEFKRYLDNFKRHGFDSTLFITKLTEPELVRMGITTRGHLQFLVGEINLLPPFEIEYKVPTNVREWLQEISLPMYMDNFRRNHIRSPKEMEILKRFDRSDIERELGIKKEGHIKRLMYAIRMLRDPSEAQQKTLRMRAAIEDCPVHYLKDVYETEHVFWERLRRTCLEPDLKAFGIEAEVKVKLVELRNNWLLMMAVINTLWLILISTLASKAELVVLGANAIGLVFLFVFGVLFSIQFLCLLVHRTSTLSHYLARASYKFGKPMHSNWSFNDKNNPHLEDSDDAEAIRQLKIDAEHALRRAKEGKRRSHRRGVAPGGAVGEKAPLIHTESV